MDSVLRAGAMYLALMVLFKIAGRRSLAELTTFDFVLLMMIGEATQQALLGDDFSITNGILVIVTLIAIDVGLSLLKQRSGWVSRLIDGEPTIIVENGKLLHRRLRHARLVEADVMEAARSSQGIERLEEIKFAIIERNGKISIIAKENKNPDPCLLEACDFLGTTVFDRGLSVNTLRRAKSCLKPPAILRLLSPCSFCLSIYGPLSACFGATKP